MGTNQDIGGYSLGIGEPDGFGIYRLTDLYTAPGILSFYYNAGSGAIMEGSRLDIYLDDLLDNSFDITAYNDPNTGLYTIDYTKELAAAKRLTIEIYNVGQSSLVFREFNLTQKTGGVIVNEKFNGLFGDWWDVNNFGNDFSSVPGALYYELYHDGVSTWIYQLMKTFTAVDISEGLVFLNTDQSAIELRAITGEWITMTNFPTDQSADPYLYLVNPPVGFNGFVNAIRKYHIIEPY